MAKTPKPAPVAETPARAGRGPNPENAKRLEHILERTKAEPGITSPALAAELEITTLQCSQLADRLVRDEQIAVFKRANGVRTYYTPKALQKVEAKLEKERERELAERETDRAEKSKAALAELKAKKAGAKTAKVPDDEDLIGSKPARKAKAPAEEAPAEEASAKKTRSRARADA